MKNYHIVHRDKDSWAVVKEGAMRAASVHKTRKEAMKAAKALLKTHPEYSLSVEGQESAAVREVAVAYNPSTGIDKCVSDFNRMFGERLKRARIMRGYSLRSLSEALEGEWSHTQLQKFEKGLASVDTKALSRLSRVLDVRPDFFVKKADLGFTEAEYRSLTKVGIKKRERLKEEAFEFFERYLEIENVVGVRRKKLPTYDLQSKSFEEIGEAIEDAAEDLRKHWQLGRNPIPNVHSMLEQHGVMVKLFDEAPKGFDGLATVGKVGEREFPSIALARSKDLPRLRLTALHELAHLVLKLPSDLEQKEKERLCHRFANAFLVPEKEFTLAFGGERKHVTASELVAIKEEWGISCKAIITRARSLGLVSKGYAKGFYIRYNRWERDYGEWIGSEESKRFDLLVNQALSKGLISVSKAAGLLGASVDSLMSGMDWQGE